MTALRVTSRSVVRRGSTLAAAFALSLAGCGGSDVGTSTQAETTVSSVAETVIDEEGQDHTAEPAREEPAVEETVDGEEAQEAEAQDNPARGTVEILTLPAGPVSLDILGGIDLDLPVDATVVLGGGCAIVEVPGYSGASPFGPGVTIAEIRFSGLAVLEPINGVGGLLALYEGEPAPEPTGESVETMDQLLVGYRIAGAFLTEPPASSFLNCSNDSAVISDLAVLPGVFSDAWVAEVDGGLLLISADGYTEEEQLEARSLLDTILPTLELAES